MPIDAVTGRTNEGTPGPSKLVFKVIPCNSSVLREGGDGAVYWEATAKSNRQLERFLSSL